MRMRSAALLLAVTSATAVAAEPTAVIRISRSLFRKVLEGFPEAARQLRDRFVERVNLANEDISRVRGVLERSSL